MKSAKQNSRKLFSGARILVLMLALAAPTLLAQVSARVIDSFTGANGSYPMGDLIFDRSGNVYGVDAYGGNVTTYCTNGGKGCGTVFELSPLGGGKWQSTVLYTFSGTGTDGADPYAGLVRDASGNLYGTTYYGGNTAGCENGEKGCGLVFELSPTSGGEWTETVIYKFNDGSSGYAPLGSLVFDSAGNLYGTAIIGGASGSFGTVFELSPNSSGVWNETVLYTFQGGNDGEFPDSGVIFDNAGNLYGTVSSGGPNLGQGYVFKLSPNSSGEWTKTDLYVFHGSDGNGPAGLTFDKAGNLYGVTGSGGDTSGCYGIGCGVAYELSPNTSGEWTEMLLYTFDNSVGTHPDSRLSFDAAGNIYGTAAGGGNKNGLGIVFKLSKSSGEWQESTLHAFGGGSDGGLPSGLVLGPSGSLFGTASIGGNDSDCIISRSERGCGVVFEIKP
jgi:uncharacterized repeat protein (TIGR03803 family)